MPDQPGTSWRIVFFSDFGPQVVQLALQLLGGMGHKVVAVVTSPGPKGRRRDTYVDIVRAVPAGIDVLVSNHPKRWAAMLAPLAPDVIMSAGFPWVIPDDVIALPRVGAINLHPSLLPRGRGPNSVSWAYRSGDRELGFSVHRLDSGLDTGAVLAQGRVPIGDDDWFETLFPRMAATVPELVMTAFARLAAGDQGDPQDESRATYAGYFEPEYRELDWAHPVREVHNRVRAWHIPGRGEAPGALATLDGERIRIFRTRMLDERIDAPAGSVLDRSDAGIVVACGDGALLVTRWEPEQPADG